MTYTFESISTDNREYFCTVTAKNGSEKFYVIYIGSIRGMPYVIDVRSENGGKRTISVLGRKSGDAVERAYESQFNVTFWGE